MKHAFFTGIMLMLCMTTKALPTDFFKPYRQTNLRQPAVPLIVNDPYFRKTCFFIFFIQ